MAFTKLLPPNTMKFHSILQDFILLVTHDTCLNVEVGKSVFILQTKM